MLEFDVDDERDIGIALSIGIFFTPFRFRTCNKFEHLKKYIFFKFMMETSIYNIKYLRHFELGPPLI